MCGSIQMFCPYSQYWALIQKMKCWVILCYPLIHFVHQWFNQAFWPGHTLLHMATCPLSPSDLLDIDATKRPKPKSLIRWEHLLGMASCNRLSSAFALKVQHGSRTGDCSSDSLAAGIRTSGVQCVLQLWGIYQCSNKNKPNIILFCSTGEAAFVLIVFAFLLNCFNPPTPTCLKYVRRTLIYIQMITFIRCSHQSNSKQNPSHVAHMSGKRMRDNCEKIFGSGNVTNFSEFSI